MNGNLIYANHVTTQCSKSSQISSRPHPRGARAENEKCKASTKEIKLETEMFLMPIF